MPKEEKNTTPPRFQAVPLLAQKFVRDYEDTVKQYDLTQQLELTDHLLDVLDLMKQYAETPDEAIWKQYKDKEEALLRKYRKTLKPYSGKKFYSYFDFDIALAEKGIYSSDEFNRLMPDQQGLTLSERQAFIRLCQNTLYNARTFLYLQMDPENAETPAAFSGETESDRAFTKARQLLTIYYLLKAGWEIEPRDNQSVSSVAKLAHLMTGTRITKIQNSDIYKKLGKIPDHKGAEQLMADLEFIRPYFVELKIAKAVEMIDEKMRQLKQLPQVKRKKLRE